MDIMDRVNLLKECGMANEEAYNDLKIIIDVFRDYHIILTEENAGTMITHFSAVFRRNTSDETLEPLAQEAVFDLKSDTFFERSYEILQSIVAKIQNEINPVEEDFVLLHICTLLNKEEVK